MCLGMLVTIEIIRAACTNEIKIGIIVYTTWVITFCHASQRQMCRNKKASEQRSNRHFSSASNFFAYSIRWWMQRVVVFSALFLSQCWAKKIRASWDNCSCIQVVIPSDTWTIPKTLK